MSSFWSMLSVLSVTLLATARASVFTEFPAPASATLYTSVEFTCAADTEYLQWWITRARYPIAFIYINEYGGYEIEQRALSIAYTINSSTGILTSVLTAVALPINDGYLFFCWELNEMTWKKRPQSFLTITGISPAEDVSLYLNSSMLYWSPPSSVPSQYQPLLSYIVNITTGINGSVVYTTTNTSLKLSSLGVCDPISVTVTVTDSGYFSNAVRAKFYHSKDDIPKPLITFNRVTGTFDTTFAISVCGSTTIFGITVSNSDSEQIHQPVYVDKVDGLTNVNYTVSLNGSINCTFTAIVNNSTGAVRDKRDSPIFTTYHVQDVSVYQVDDSVRVECTFVYQSIADGCHIKLTTDGSIIQSFNISLINESNIASGYITPSVNGIYSITAYDIVNGIITDTPSVQYDDIFQYMSLMDSVTTSDITDTPTSTTTSDTTLLLPSD